MTEQCRLWFDGCETCEIKHGDNELMASSHPNATCAALLEWGMRDVLTMLGSAHDADDLPFGSAHEPVRNLDSAAPPPPPSHRRCAAPVQPFCREYNYRNLFGHGRMPGGPKLAPA